VRAVPRYDRYGIAYSAAFVNGVLDEVAARLGLEGGQQPPAHSKDKA
jgi:hypothetical protein